MSKEKAGADRSSLCRGTWNTWVWLKRQRGTSLLYIRLNEGQISRFRWLLWDTVAFYARLSRQPPITVLGKTRVVCWKQKSGVRPFVGANVVICPQTEDPFQANHRTEVAEWGKQGQSILKYLYVQTEKGKRSRLSWYVSHDHIVQIILQMPKVLLWTRLNIVVFDLANQRLPESIIEDQLNKPSRPLAAGRIKATQTRSLLLLTIPLVLATTCFYLGSYEEMVLLFVWSGCVVQWSRGIGRRLRCPEPRCRSYIHLLWLRSSLSGIEYQCRVQEL